MALIGLVNHAWLVVVWLYCGFLPVEHHLGEGGCPLKPFPIGIGSQRDPSGQILRRSTGGFIGGKPPPNHLPGTYPDGHAWFS